MNPNIQGLRKDLITLFHELRDGTVKPVVGCEMNNAAGKAIASVKIEIEYLREKSRNKDLAIAFMEPGKPLSVTK